MNPGGGSGREEPPLGIQIPDDARELDRDLLAYRREQRVQRRRSRLRKLTAPFGGTGTVMPLLASILAVCLVAGAMLSVATFGPSTSANKTHPPAGATSATKTTAAASRSPAATASSSHSAATASTRATATGATPSGTTASGTTAAETTAAGASPPGVRPSAAAGAPQPTPARHAVSSAAP